MQTEASSSGTRRVAVITGASAGIGRATALAFARQGWRVALLARGRDRLLAAAEEVRQLGGRALAIPLDIANEKEVEAAAQSIETELGAIEVWVNNAMATVFSPFSSIAPDEFRRATEVTYLGAVWGTSAALKRMLARDRGTIVQVGSALAYRSIPLQSAYCGAKSALRGFTDSLRSELIHQNTRVQLTMVHLSAFNTPQFDWARNHTGRFATPLGKIFEPEVAAEAIYWAATHKRREVWVGFPAVQAILGTRMMPGFLDRYLAYRAYDGQLTDARLPAGYVDNLFSPAPGDFGARGRFSARARGFSLQWWLSAHRWLGSAAAIAALLALGMWLAGGSPY